MAGVKGRSGGPRANTGGARPGAGRKPAPKPEPVLVADDGVDMLSLLQRIALGQIDVTPTQLRAAIAAVAYTHAKRDDAGKKAAAEERAKGAAAGKYEVRQGPRLVASK